MSKTLRKAIMKRSKLQNTFNKKRSSENWRSYKRQCNICSNILKSTKKTFFETLNPNEITDNRKFWKTVKPFFTDKCKTTNNIILTEKYETLNDNKKISNNFNEYFTNITKGLNLRESIGNINFENEECCKKIKENFGNETFSFETISKTDVLNLIKKLPGNKATVSNDIPVSVHKESVSAYYEKLTNIFNNCIRSGTFPEILKKSEITPAFKKGYQTSKTDYRPVSTLSSFSKIFEKLIYLQLNNYMQSKFSIYLTGFRKNHGTQHALLKMIETWKTKLNTGHKVGVIYMDLSKAFDTLNHELLIAKLRCYGLDQNAVEFFKSYLTSRF